MFKKRIGPDPHSDNQMTPGVQGCPDIWELEDGNFAIIGAEVTNLLSTYLPTDASCGPDEAIVRIPRSLLIKAKSSIPEK